MTLKELAKMVNLSKSTISKYLNEGNVREENRKKIEEAIAKTGFRPNYIAKSLKTSKTYTIGVLVPFLVDVFAATIISRIESKVKNAGYSIVVASYQGNKKEFKEKLTFLHDRMVDMVVVFPSNISKDDFDVKVKSEKPILLIDQQIDGMQTSAVLIDNFDICRQAADYLCKFGHRKIAVITGNRSSVTANQRVAGCIAAFKENGLTEDDYIIRYGNFSFESGVEMVNELLRENKEITAIMATNYYLTNSVLKFLNDAKLNIPEDLSVIGFDNIEVSNIMRNSLVLATQPMDEIGDVSAEIILDKLCRSKNEDRVVVLKGSLKEGESVCAPRKPRRFKAFGYIIQKFAY